ncbi:MAG TPA: hypothetical protein GXX28_10750 [Firmicutes bacterium]|nr:hypothetical protein [Bacillota bacterium]
MKAQVTLTVAEAKRLIAKALANEPAVQAALHGGLVFLKGGTTVSAVAEELTGQRLRVSGRITPQGAKRAKAATEECHCMLLERGSPVYVSDREMRSTVARLGRGDVVITGANALDIHGNAAIMAGSPFGGPPGEMLNGLIAEGVTVFVAVGLEKLIPGSIREAILACGRKSIDLSMGMPVGLIPVTGQVITEVEALQRYADVRCAVIGAGGILGAEGATTLVMEGETAEVQRAFELVLAVKGAETGGAPGSLPECEGFAQCGGPHKTCIYAHPPKLTGSGF